MENNRGDQVKIRRRALLLPLLLVLALLPGCATIRNAVQQPDVSISATQTLSTRSSANAGLKNYNRTAQTTPQDGSQPFDATQLDPRVTQNTIGSTIGISGYTKTVRPPSSATNRIKLNLMREHGYTGDPAQWELDHFIPLAAGGSSNLSNLWLQPIAEARLKDQDENRAHSMVTSGVWTLEQGQQYIRDHWHIYYN
jgi:hypothetical protein